MGDLGLLCRDIFPQKNTSKLYDVGIICHLNDKNSSYLKNIKFNQKSYSFIDISSSTKEFCEKINKCKFILSSSLHGLIISDSYGIPNQRIILTTNNNPGSTRYDFKFDDYYSIYNIETQKAIDLTKSTINDNDIDYLTSNYKQREPIIKDFCDNYKKLIKEYFFDNQEIQKSQNKLRQI